MKDLHIYKAVLLGIFLSIKPCKGTKSQPKADHCLAGLDFLLRDQSYRHIVSIVLEFVLEWHSYLYATYFSLRGLKSGERLERTDLKQNRKNDNAPPEMILSHCEFVACKLPGVGHFTF